MTTSKTVSQQIPLLNVTPSMMGDQNALYRALTDYSKDIESYLRRTADTLNQNIRGAFQSSGTGWFTTPAGYLVQWGSTTASSTGVVTSFPTAFPTGCQAILLQQQGNASPAADTLAAEVLSKTQFEAFSSAAGPVNVWFLAVGT